MVVIECIENLEAVLVDYSTAQAQGLKECIKAIVGEKKGPEEAEPLLKGCAVHCLRSCKMVATLSVDGAI